MSPRRIDPAMDYQRLAQLAEEFKSLWTKLQGFYLDAAVGFSATRQSVQRLQARSREYVRGSELDSEEFQDSLPFSYDSIFQSSFCTSGIHDATQGEVKARNAASGDNHRLLGQRLMAKVQPRPTR